jgi:hypothetical protein
MYVSSFAKPSGTLRLRGADGDPASSVWVAVDEFGIAIFYDGANPTPIRMVDTGELYVTGIAMLGNDRFALSAENKIIEGYFTADMWHETGTHALIGGLSTINDLDYALGHYFIATASDGIRRVESDWSSTVVYNLDDQLALKMFEFKPDTYDNSMMEFANNNAFINTDSSGMAFGDTKGVHPYNSFNIQGLAYFSGGFAVVQSTKVDIHNPFTFQQYLAPMSVPEPSTALLLLAATPLLLLRRRKS